METSPIAQRHGSSPQEKLYKNASSIRTKAGELCQTASGQVLINKVEAIPDGFSFGRFRIVPSTRLLERDGIPTSLGSRAFDLLCVLISCRGEVVSKAKLMAATWPGLTVDESSLRFHITQLRRVLDQESKGASYVINVPGRGYSFVGEFQEVHPLRKPIQGSEVAPSPHLPQKPIRFIGREADVAALVEHFSGRRFVTICGPGGIGKTTLAIAAAHAMGNRFQDGIRFIDLGSLSDPQHVAVAVASALGMLVPVGDPSPRLMQSLRDQEMLLVFDSCEHLVEAVARLAEQICSQAPNISIMATSREALGVAGELVLALAPLDSPPEGVCDEAGLAQYSSARLFVDCATAAGCSLKFTNTETEIIARICRKLDGVPLAIELVASRLSAHGLIEIDELIEGRLRLALRGRRTAPVRHRSLSAALDWSYELISEAERSLLELLSVFPGQFTLQGVGALVEANDGSRAVIDSLDQLIAKSLVASRPKAGQLRFRLLDTTRAYAADKLAKSSVAQAASQRHTRYVIQALTPRSYEAGGEYPGGWANRSDLLPDARAALTWAFSSGGDADLRIPVAAVCARLFVELNLLEECRVWAERALAASEAAHANPVLKVELLWAFGHAAMFTERSSVECEAALWRGLELAQQICDLHNQFRILSRLHALYRRTDDRRKLLEVALLAEAVATKISDPAASARADTFLGIAFHLSGDQRVARMRLQAGEAGDARIPNLPIDHFASPRGTNILSCSNLWLLGFPDRAVAVANSLIQPNSNPDLVMYCGGLLFAARVCRWVGDLGGTERIIDQLEGYSRKHGYGPMLTVALALKGELHVARGAFEEGIKLLRPCLPRMIADRFELHSGAIAIALVKALAASGKLAEGAALLDTRIEAVAARGESWEMPELKRIRGELRLQSNDISGAEHDFRSAIELAERQSALSWRLRAASSLVRHAKSESAANAARAELQQTYGRFKEGFESADLRAARELLRN